MESEGRSIESKIPALTTIGPRVAKGATKSSGAVTQIVVNMVTKAINIVYIVYDWYLS